MSKKLLVSFFLLFLFPSVIFAEEQFPFLGEIAADDVNVRAGQSTNYERLCQLNKGAQVVVLEKKFSWYKIRLPLEASCFIHGEYVEMVSGDVAKVKTDNVNLRAGTSPKSAIIGKANHDKLIRIREKIDEWYRIEPTAETSGWISEEFIKFVSRNVPPPQVVEMPPAPAAQPAIPPEQEKSKAPKLVPVIGRIEDLGRILPNKDIRYKLVGEDKTIYYLEGPRRIIDPFVHSKVKVEGYLKNETDGNLNVPVITVVKISLIL